jgi:hypothetical protein
VLKSRLRGPDRVIVTLCDAAGRCVIFRKHHDILFSTHFRYSELRKDVGYIRSDVQEEDAMELCDALLCGRTRAIRLTERYIYTFFQHNFPGIAILPPNVSMDGFKIYPFFSTELVTQSLQKETVADRLLRVPACCVFSRSLATASNSGDSSASLLQILYSQPPVQN